MKIVILGGAGGQGLHATRGIIKGGVFNEIVVASRNVENSQKVIEQLDAGDIKIKAEKIDVMDKEALVDLIQDADVVANCTGPYYLLGEYVVEASIEAGKHYVDFCDDVTVHKKLFSGDYHKRAQEKDISMIIGLGASPGIMPLQAYEMAKDLDIVEDIDFYMGIDVLDDADGAAVLLHVIENFVDDIDIIKDGELATEKPFEGAIFHDFGAPIGEIMISTMGHPETFTLPRVLPEAQNIKIKLGFYPSKAFETLKVLIEDGLASEDPIIVNGEEIIPRDYLVSHLIENLESEAARPLGEPITGSMIRVRGIKDGKKIERKSSSFSQMGPSTGYPLAIGAELLAKGEIEKTGILVPEEALDGESFLYEFGKRAFEAGHISFGKSKITIEEITGGEEYFEKLK